MQPPSEPERRRAGVVEISRERLAQMLGLRADERITSVKYAPHLATVRVTIEGGWLPAIVSGAEAPVVARL